MDTNGTEIKVDAKPVARFQPSVVCETDGCGKRFINEEVLRLHRKSHFTQRIQCLSAGCQYESGDRRALVEHMKSEHRIAPFVCVYDTCGQLFDSRDGFETHVQRKHLHIFKCHSVGCGKNFFSEQHFECHVKICDTTLNCNIQGCDYRCDRVQQLNDHMNVHLVANLSPPIPQTTPKLAITRDPYGSGVQLIRQKYLTKGYGIQKKKKMKTKKMKRQFRCDQSACNYRCDRAVDFARHKRTHKQQQRQQQKQRFQCAHMSCGQQFAAEDTLEEHVNDAHRGFRCEFAGCHKVLKTRLSLRQHMKLHTNTEKAFRCPAPLCHKLFRTKYNRDTHHKRMHSVRDDRVYVCERDDCLFATNQLAAFNAHKESHRDPRNYPCVWPDCGKRYRNKYLLKYHALTHQRINCETLGCGYSCVDSKQMADHKAKQHSPATAVAVKPIIGSKSHKIFANKSRNKPIVKKSRVDSPAKDRPSKDCDSQLDHNKDTIKHTNTHKPVAASAAVSAPLVVAHKTVAHPKDIKTSFRCGHESCGKSFITEHTLNKHLTETHANRVTTPTTAAPITATAAPIAVGSKYRCDYPDCNKVLKTKAILCEHKKIHENSEKQFPCPVTGCDKLFRTKYNRDTHAVRVHRSERLFVCDWKGCRFATNQLRPFNAHKASHRAGAAPPIQTKPLNCPSVRGDKTAAKSQPILRKHNCVKSGTTAANTRHTHSTATSAASGAAVTYPCKRANCRQRFKTRTELNAHTKSHNRRKYRCGAKGCPFTAADASKLTIHKRNKHENRK
ncbi:unnamed protein product [Medioppia subpectinata]|uniref:C2H2-type domain-containing protein n=1 Tax=Medioppia subpectinata TaxID=1979941 RepID=A0A7R9PVE1_9ACAR|nr:unnamed protein product [Medioppia subpectinata]CAG2102733.1 unnamed protein product [Medioppia subpectinata]